MTAALKDRPTFKMDGCRFPDWCRGVCDDGRGERNHWGSQTRVWAFDVADERISVELWDYENDRDGVDPVLVYIAAGDHDFDEDGCPIPTEQARSLGILLRDFTPQHRPECPEDEHIYTAVDVNGEWAVIADYRKERALRNDDFRDEHIEFSIRPDSTRRHSIRVRLSVPDAKRFGRLLVREADRAAASNLQFGLEAA